MMAISNLEKLEKIDQEFADMIVQVQAKGRFVNQDTGLKRTARELLNELHRMFIDLSKNITAAQHEIGDNQSLGISQSIDAVEAFFLFIKNEHENTNKFVDIATSALNQLKKDIDSIKISSNYAERSVSALQGVGFSLIAFCKSCFTVCLLALNVIDRNKFKTRVVNHFKPTMDHFNETWTGKKESKKLNDLAKEISSLLIEYSKPPVQNIMGFFKVENPIKPDAPLSKVTMPPRHKEEVTRGCRKNTSKP